MEAIPLMKPWTKALPLLYSNDPKLPKAPAALPGSPRTSEIIALIAYLQRVGTDIKAESKQVAENK